jgi:hypothetical protein
VDTFFNICIEEEQMKLVLRWDELYATQKILAPQMRMEREMEGEILNHTCSIPNLTIKVLKKQQQ